MGPKVTQRAEGYDGTLALPNPKHEAFAQAVATGIPASKAYVAAGYKAKNNKTARACSSSLLSRSEVTGRVAHLKPTHDAEFQRQVQITVTDKIHDRVERIRGYAERWAAMRELMRQRAADPEHQDVVGIRTGLLVVSYTTVNKETFKEAKFDAALQRALLDVEKQAAIELRQWVERREDLPGNGDLRALTDSQLDQLIAHLEKKDPEGVAQASRELGVPLGPIVDVVPTPAAETSKSRNSGAGEAAADEARPLVKIDPFA